MTFKKWIQGFDKFSDCQESLQAIVGKTAASIIAFIQGTLNVVKGNQALMNLCWVFLGRIGWAL